LLAHSNLPKLFWEDTFLTTVFIINTLITPILDQKSPYEMVHHQKPDYNFFCAFRCACWPIYIPIIAISLIFDPKTAFLLGIILVIEVTNV